jgi:hypothetical protein
MNTGINKVTKERDDCKTKPEQYAITLPEQEIER